MHSIYLCSQDFFIIHTKRHGTNLLEALLQQMKTQNLAPAATYVTYQTHNSTGDNVVNKVG